MKFIIIPRSNPSLADRYEALNEITSRKEFRWFQYSLNKHVNFKWSAKNLIEMYINLTDNELNMIFF